MMPARISRPPTACGSDIGSPANSQPNTAPAIASRKMTRAEKAAGRCPSAKARRPWPPAWLTTERPTMAAAPSSRRQDARLDRERHGEQREAGDDGREEGDLRCRLRPPRDAHRQEIGAEKDGGREAAEIAEEMVRCEMPAHADQEGRPDEAEREAGEDAARDMLADEEARAERDPDRSHGGEEDRVGDRGVQDREVPEDEVGGEEQPGIDDGRVEAEEIANCPPRAPSFDIGPDEEKRDRGADSPERAGEGADLGMAHEDRRDRHGEGAHDERRQGQRLRPLAGMVGHDRDPVGEGVRMR